MTPRQRTAVRAVRLRADADGRIGPATDLAAAECLAGQAAAGARVHLHTAAFTGPLTEWARTLGRGAPGAVVLAADPTARPLADLLAERLTGGSADRPAVVCDPGELAGALARVTGSAPGNGASPYAARVLTPAQAALAGVRARAADTLADLELLARRANGPIEVALRPAAAGDGTWAPEGELVAGLGGLADRLARARLVPRPRLSPAELTPAAAEALAASGIARATIAATAQAGEEHRLRAALSAATAAGLSCAVEFTVPGPKGESGGPPEASPTAAEHVARLLRACPDAVPDLPAAPLAALAARAAFAGVPPHAAAAAELRRHRRTLRAFARRALVGGYGATAISAGAHDLWWEHSEAVAAHAGWVADVVAAGGTVLTPADAAGPVRGYADADTRAPGPGVLLIRTEADRDALLADADAARRRGVFPARLFDPAPTLAGLCRLGRGGCPAERGRRLYVDPRGRVRGGPHGPVLGKVGEPLEELRAALRERTAAGCSCLPSGWAPAAPRLWLDRVLDAARSVAALRALAARGEHPAPASAPSSSDGGPLAVSGLGGALGHAAAPAPRWPEGLVLLRDGGAHLLHHGPSGTWARLPAPLAVLVELRLDLGPAAADHLARHHAMSARTAAAALERAGAALERLTASPATSPDTGSTDGDDQP
ncbi:hypothetical protein [Streptomonospora wellingtoniae]|uniref:Uncharacterized protein n=1 Tax=Streptomonospora wellingtoniae TaxID=3075544 RepID=A0ABU2KRJ2_9ACTN|nr:hypothetical protein [Streptomonospora sp. DSM 45055]MDT0301900.1 hypothetical protein [Streptomonospora sp. DSM 45055]